MAVPYNRCSPFIAPYGGVFVGDNIWRERLNPARKTHELILMFIDGMPGMDRVLGTDVNPPYLTLVSVDEEMRKRMFKFFEFCRSQNLHTFVITERQTGEFAELEGNEGFLADSILNLGLDRRNGQIVRTLQIEKMRHIRHSMEKQAMEVANSGLVLLGPLFD